MVKLLGTCFLTNNMKLVFDIFKNNVAGIWSRHPSWVARYLPHTSDYCHTCLYNICWYRQQIKWNAILLRPYTNHWYTTEIGLILGLTLVEHHRQYYGLHHPVTNIAHEMWYNFRSKQKDALYRRMKEHLCFENKHKVKIDSKPNRF